MTVKPRNVVTGPTFLCLARPRRCERVDTLHCTACGWWSSAPAAGDTMDLFAAPEHTDEDCARRQTDPGYRWEQDSARLVAAGLPAPPRPRKPHRPAD